MKIRVATLALAAVISSAAFFLPVASAAMKCPPRRVVPSQVRAPGLPGETAPAVPASLDAEYVPAPTVYLLDARIVTETEFKSAQGEFESISVVCSEERHQIYGVDPGSNLVIGFTAPGPYSALEANVMSIAKLQETCFARTGEFAPTVDDLGWKDPSGLITIELSVTGSRPM
jgi:hypothetical protein